MELDSEEAAGEAPEAAAVVEGKFESVFVAGDLHAKQVGQIEPAVSAREAHGSRSCAVGQAKFAAKQGVDKRLQAAHMRFA